MEHSERFISIRRNRLISTLPRWPRKWSQHPHERRGLDYGISTVSWMLPDGGVHLESRPNILCHLSSIIRTYHVNVIPFDPRYMIDVTCHSSEKHQTRKLQYLSLRHHQNWDSSDLLREMATRMGKCAIEFSGRVRSLTAFRLQIPRVDWEKKNWRSVVQC